MARVSRWLDETGGARGASYDQAFQELAASGVDVHGEAAYVAALLAPGARVVDAGCGTGRVGVELARRGFAVVGVDSDASMLDVARSHPDVRWELDDLATSTLALQAELVVAAGNVVVFLAEGTEPAAVAVMAGWLAPAGLLVSGWRTDRLAPEVYDGWCAEAGLTPVARHSTWQGAPWTDGADWCVAVHRAGR